MKKVFAKIGSVSSRIRQPLTERISQNFLLVSIRKLIIKSENEESRKTVLLNNQEFTEKEHLLLAIGKLRRQYLVKLIPG